jgi:hypothetical protein
MTEKGKNEADSRIAGPGPIITKPGMPSPWPSWPPPTELRDKELAIKLLRLAIDLLGTPVLPKPLFREGVEQTPEKERDIIK